MRSVLLALCFLFTFSFAVAADESVVLRFAQGAKMISVSPTMKSPVRMIVSPELEELIVQALATFSQTGESVIMSVIWNGEVRSVGVVEPRWLLKRRALEHFIEVIVEKAGLIMDSFAYRNAWRTV